MDKIAQKHNTFVRA